MAIEFNANDTNWIAATDHGPSGSSPFAMYAEFKLHSLGQVQTIYQVGSGLGTQPRMSMFVSANGYLYFEGAVDLLIGDSPCALNTWYAAAVFGIPNAVAYRRRMRLAGGGYHNFAAALSMPAPSVGLTRIGAGDPGFLDGAVARVGFWLGSLVFPATDEAAFRDFIQNLEEYEPTKRVFLDPLDEFAPGFTPGFGTSWPADYGAITLAVATDGGDTPRGAEGPTYFWEKTGALFVNNPTPFLVTP